MTSEEKHKSLKDDLARRIGQNLKIFRKAAGLSQKNLAEAVGFSSTLISRIENGFVRPSLSTLEVVSNSLKVDIGFFFKDEDQRRFTISRKDSDRKTISGKTGELIELIVEGVDNAYMEPVIVTLKGKDQEDQVDLTVHDGQEFMYVLDGKMELTLGTKKYILETGDAAYWYGDIPHRGISLSKHTAHTMNVHMIPGKRVGIFKTLADQD